MTDENRKNRSRRWTTVDILGIFRALGYLACRTEKEEDVLRKIDSEERRFRREKQ